MTTKFSESSRWKRAVDNGGSDRSRKNCTNIQKVTNTRGATVACQTVHWRCAPPAHSLRQRWRDTRSPASKGTANRHLRSTTPHAGNAGSAAATGYATQVSEQNRTRCSKRKAQPGPHPRRRPRHPGTQAPPGAGRVAQFTSKLPPPRRWDRHPNSQPEPSANMGTRAPPPLRASPTPNPHACGLLGSHAVLWGRWHGPPRAACASVSCRTGVHLPLRSALQPPSAGSPCRPAQKGPAWPACRRHLVPTGCRCPPRVAATARPRRRWATQGQRALERAPRSWLQ